MYRVMLVDDEKWVLEDLKKLIDWRAFEFEVVAAVSSCESALNLCKHTKPHLIISDISMPGMSGLEFLHAIKSKWDSEICVIMISAYEEFAFAKEALKNQAMDYLLKPINKKELIDSLQRVKDALEGTTIDENGSFAPKRSVGIEAAEKAVEYIKDNYDKKVTIYDVAKLLHINPNYLSSVYKELTGSTFTNYLTTYRMERAIELSLSTELAGYQIAEKVGYPDYVHFSKVFKKYKGITFNEFRASNSSEK